MKGKRLGSIILLFLGAMFVLTVVSRSRDSLKTPKVKVALPSAQVITYEIEKRLVAEPDTNEGLSVKCVLTEEEAGYIDSSASVQVESAAKNVLLEDAVIYVEKNENSGQREMTVTFQDNRLEAGDAVIVKARYSSQPYACCVPASAVQMGADNNYFVYVTEEQDVILGERIVAKAVEVQVEEMDQRYAALKNDSLGQEQQVIYEWNKEFQKNDRVRVVERN